MKDTRKSAKPQIPVGRVDIFPNRSHMAFLARGLIKKFGFAFQSEPPETNTPRLAAEMVYLGKMPNVIVKNRNFDLKETQTNASKHSATFIELAQTLI